MRHPAPTASPGDAPLPGTATAPAPAASPADGRASSPASSPVSATDASPVPALAPSAAGSAAMSPPSRVCAPTAACRPQLSVVVPTCGRPLLLLRCLSALVQQTLDPQRYEILVVDDARCERTRALVEQLAAAAPHPVLRYLRPSTGRGPAHARNLGWQAGFGEIVAFTDDDTVAMEDWLAQGLQALRDPHWEAVAGQVQVPRPEAGRPTDHHRMTEGLERTAFVTANAFVRRRALVQVQGFDERFTRAWREDSDLHFRLEDGAGAVGRCEQAVVLHPVRAERWGVSLRQQRNAFFEALLYAKHPRRYREQVGLPVPWDYYLIVALALLAWPLALAGVTGSAVVSALLALGLVLRLAARRLRGTSHGLGHVLEMLATSVLIPLLSVYWRLRGALHFRVWFF